jgi:hypothetical protein
MTFHLAADRIGRYWRQQGTWRTARFLGSRILRCRRYVVYETDLSEPRAATEWLDGEELHIIGPDTIDSAIIPEMQSFLGGGDAAEHLEGIRQGDRLFVVAYQREFQHCGYILFETRQTRILGEEGNPPLIASCATVPAARGRGLYRRALNAELCYLRDLGYGRAVIETDPENIGSRKGIEGAGFRLIRETSVWILLNWMVLQRSLEGSRRKWRLFAV